MNSESGFPVRTPLKLRSGPAAAIAGLSKGSPWKLLVVDDEQGVHAVTRVALSELRYRDRPVTLLSAYSAQDALRFLREESDIAVCLLDVVMEQDDAGLKLVETIRNDLENQAIRIILRTGQPGQAPEQRVILDYDINDYKAKSELSAQRLFTSVVSALRSYETIVELQRHRNGLRRILDKTDALFVAFGVADFASVVLAQLAEFLECQPNGILCAHPTWGATRPDAPIGSDLVVMAAAGDYVDCNGCRLDSLGKHTELVAAVGRVEETKASLFTENMSILYLDTPPTHSVIVLRHGPRPVTEQDRNLLEIFVGKVKLAQQSVVWHERMTEAEHAATTDFLTGLTNRRHLMHLGSLLLAGTRRRNSPLLVAMIDIDHFKDVNDTFGHSAGDKVLKDLADVLKRRFRQSDLVARLGGEEFCVLVADSDQADVVALFEALRLSIAQHPFEVGGAPRQITISIGIAASGEDYRDGLDAIIARADARLYTAKREGRNRLVSG